MRSEKRKDMYADRYHAGAKGQKHCHYAKHRKTNSIRRFVTGIAALVMVMSLSFGFGSFFSPVRTIAKLKNLPERDIIKVSSLKKGIHSGALHKDTDEQKIPYMNIWMSWQKQII